MNPIAEDILMHYGVGHLDGGHSGRYPWGSGENPTQRYGDLLDRVEKMKKDNPGMKETEIAEALGIKTTSLRSQLSIAKAERRAALVERARDLRDQGLSLQQIANEMGYSNDSSVRSLLNESSAKKMNQAQVTADYLKQMVDEKGMIDVGNGVERELGVSREKLRQALQILSEEGYETYGGGMPQVTNIGKQTNLKVLCPPGTEHKDIYNFDQVHSVREYDKILTDDGNKIRKAFEYPSSLDSSRVAVRYAEEGGLEKDGVVELRRGVPDLSLGEAHYAQVRIMVDGTHYIKGMAVYSDDLPDGVDVLFNTNKKVGTPMLGEDKNNTVFKPIKDDPDNPFGSLIKEHGGQSYYIGPDGKEHLSPINKAREEGDWNDWSDHLPSQFLSKQPLSLINKQLNLSIADKMDEYDDIKSYTNPTIKKQLLYSFAEDCDAAAVHLQAAALPRQKYQVLLPLTTISDNEVYAPNYKDGEKVALIRYPHGGTFEIPILTVNNKNAEGRKVMGTSPKDAIGVNAHVEARLSGADNDGDTVMVIPTGGRNVKIMSTPPLPGLEGFDPKIEYGPDSTDKPYKKMKATQLEMGKISNLITDMTLRNATDSEKARAVRHSMVVIDAEKHGLDYRRSERENGIAELKRKYQGHYDENGEYHEGAATLISRAKSEESVPKRQGSPRIAEDGSLVYKTASDNKLYYVDKKGNKKMRTEKSTKMAETKDAYTLVSDANTPQERAYAEYANKLKALANEARKEMVNTKEIPYSPQARKIYDKEVKSLEAQLKLAELNAPREREAQRIANTVVKAKKEANPEMKTKEIKKASQQAITEARQRVGAARKPITFTDREWEAIQAGAITKSNLSKIAKYADKNELRERATPRAKTELSDAKKARIKAMKASHYSNQMIAEAIGCSVSTVIKYS